MSPFHTTEPQTWINKNYPSQACEKLMRVLRHKEKIGYWDDKVQYVKIMFLTSCKFYCKTLQKEFKKKKVFLEHIYHKKQRRGKCFNGETYIWVIQTAFGTGKGIKHCRNRELQLQLQQSCNLRYSEPQFLFYFFSLQNGNSWWNKALYLPKLHLLR